LYKDLQLCPPQKKKSFVPFTKISEKNLVIYAFEQKIQNLKKRKYFGEKEKKMLLEIN